ncbi:DUF2254 domain-containing protein [Amnibacterium flavum]|nr:DUF2254 domain-containing protein [Amnibacterium flavum]
MTKSRGWIARVSESIESRLWPLPVASIVVAVLLGIYVPRLDLAIDEVLPPGVDSIVFNGGAETARSVLSSIAGSLITATSLTFSLTVVALQLASSQASPRVLRLFSRDRQVHATLAVFLGTFAYAITVLRSVRDSTDEIPEFAPRIAVTGGFVLTLVSVVVLVFFLAHLAAQLRVETIMKEIHAETDRTIDLVGDGNAAANAYSHPIEVPASKHVVTAESSGFLTSCDRGGLVKLASSHGIVIEETKRVGESVVAGAPQAYWWPRDGRRPTDPAEIAREIRKAFVVGYERTAAQDIDYGLQQILDIGVRALSAGINDPTTAVNALGHLSALVSRAVEVPQLPAGLADGDDELAVVTIDRPPARIVEESLTPMRHYGGSSPAVVVRFLQLISDLHYTCPGAAISGALIQQLIALETQLRGDSTDPALMAVLIEQTARLRDRIEQS